MLAFALLPLASAQERALVGVHSAEATAPLEALTARLGGETLRCWGSLDICLLGFPGPAPLQALAAAPGVRWAEADRPMALTPPSPGRDPAPPPPFSDAEGTADCPDLWELDTLRAQTAWEQVSGLHAPIVAVQDSGFLTTHLELGDAIAFQYDFGDDDPTAEVSWGSGVPAHGSFIAGLIAADPDNGRGRAGLAPRAQLYVQKIADSTGALYYSYAVAAMAALLEGQTEVGVLSYSLASSHPDTAMGEAVAALQAADILVIAAAGNCTVSDCIEADNDQNPLYPAGFGGAALLSVAGTTPADGFNPYSHYGLRTVHLAAPGVDLCSLGVSSNTAFEVASGTSYATPLVAAAAALVREAHPQLSAVETAQALLVSAWPLDALQDRVLTGGRLDPVEALAVTAPRLTLPGTLEVLGEGPLTVEVENIGAEGEVWIIVTLGEALRALELEAPAGWALTAFPAGAALSLPDLGAVTAEAAGALLHGPVGAHSAASLTLNLRATDTTEGTLSARALGVGGARAVMRWPYAGPETLTNGAVLWSELPLRAEALPDSPAVDSGLGQGPDRCGGCTSGPRGGLALALGALALARRAPPRRRP